MNAILYRVAVTRLRCEPRAKTLYAQARANNHTKKGPRRIIRRVLSDVVYRRMTRDAPRPAPPRCMTADGRRAVQAPARQGPAQRRP